MISLEEAKMHLRIDGNDEDAWLNTWIPAVTGAILSWLKDPWRAYVQAVDSDGSPIVDSNGDPVPAVDSSGDPVVLPMVKAAALLELAACYPDALGYETLFARAAARVRQAGHAGAAEDVNGLLTELFLLFAHQAVGMTPLEHSFHRRIDARPRAHRLARAQAAAGLGHIATARHSSILLDPFSTRLLECLDGTRDVAQLTRRLTDDIRQGIVVLPDLKPATPDQLHTQVRTNVERFLRLFARQGVLAGSEA